MANKENHITYTAADIEKYYRGQLTAAEMHALEKAALDDPFLADAMEGYAGAQASIPADIGDLEARLADRIREKNKKPVALPQAGTSSYWWKLAAMLVIIAGAGLLVYQFAFNPKNNDIAQAVKKGKTPVPDSGAPDSTGGQKAVVRSQPAQESPVKQKTEIAGTGREKKVSRNEAAQKIDSAAQTTRPAASPNETAAAIEKNNDVERRQQKMQQRELAAVAKDQEAKSLSPVSAARAKPLPPSQRFYRQGNKTYNAPFLFRGRVTDEENNALPFSNIMNTHDSVGTYADASGYFNLISPDSILRVRVSSVGFEPSIVSLQKDVATNFVKLESDQSGLAEVVISSKKVNTNRVRNSMVLGDAEPADGWSNYDLYLANNLQEPDYPTEKKEAGIHGEVELSFEVSKSGEPINITVKKSLCEACDREAIRLLKEGPKWRRKAKKGKATVTIRF